MHTSVGSTTLRSGRLATGAGLTAIQMVGACRRPDRRRQASAIMRVVKAYLRVAKRLIHEPHLPKPLRALIVLGLLPLPGPVDEIALLTAALTIALFYRPRFKALLDEERAGS